MGVAVIILSSALSNFTFPYCYCFTVCSSGTTPSSAWESFIHTILVLRVSCSYTNTDDGGIVSRAPIYMHLPGSIEFVVCSHQDHSSMNCIFDAGGSIVCPRHSLGFPFLLVEWSGGSSRMQSILVTLNGYGW